MTRARVSRARRVAIVGAAIASLAACEPADLTLELPVRPNGPVPFLEGATLRSIDASSGIRWRTCAVDDEGVARCQPFFGTTTERFQAAVPFRTVATGLVHACALDEDGQAWCWGEGYAGQLGTGGSTMAPRPVLADGPAFVRLVARGQGACGVTAANELYCWGTYMGDQDDPQCPDCFVMDSVPTPVFPQLAVVDVALGASHTCVVTTGQDVYCWGANYAAQLGTGDFIGRQEPTLVDAPPAASIVVGMEHTCSLGTSGNASCWGANIWGELGIGESSTLHQTTPTPVVGGHSFTRLSAGNSATCALDADGAAWCWGQNFQNRVTWDDQPFYDVPTRLPGAPPFVEITTSGEHSCARTAAGAGYCWGAGSL